MQKRTVSSREGPIHHRGAIYQLRTQSGIMAQLARDEQGELKLDWVEEVQRLLASPSLLDKVEQEARTLWQRGVRHVIWSGMGGSIEAVKMLVDLGFGRQPNGIMIHPLNSTDPAAINAVVQEIVNCKQMSLPVEGQPDKLWVQQLCEDILLVSVAMSNTSEESLTHLQWFLDLMLQAQMDPRNHLLVLTTAQSRLALLAQEHALPTLPLMLDGYKGFMGRMSAPCTRVFLLPVALHFAHHDERERGQLVALLQQAWCWHSLDVAEQDPSSHPFACLATDLLRVQDQGICRLFLALPQEWGPVFTWIEQLLGQSLSKEGKGILVFRELEPPVMADADHGNHDLHIQVTSFGVTGKSELVQTYLRQTDPVLKLAALAASCLGWQLATALYAYHCHIPFATEPGVERYKALAKALLQLPDPLMNVDLSDPFVLMLSRHRRDRATTFAEVLVELSRGGGLPYLDITFNGEPSGALTNLLSSHLQIIGQRLETPTTFRIAPAVYHISEQSALDGPAALSLRIVPRDHVACRLGTYRANYLRAQAAATWKAMRERGRQCFLLLVDESGSPGGMLEALDGFFTQIEHYLQLREDEYV